MYSSEMIARALVNSGGILYYNKFLKSMISTLSTTNKIHLKNKPEIIETKSVADSLNFMDPFGKELIDIIGSPRNNYNFVNSLQFQLKFDKETTVMFPGVSNYIFEYTTKTKLTKFNITKVICLTDNPNQITSLNTILTAKTLFTLGCSVRELITLDIKNNGYAKVNLSPLKSILLDLSRFV